MLQRGVPLFTKEQTGLDAMIQEATASLCDRHTIIGQDSGVIWLSALLVPVNVCKRGS